MSGHGAGPRGLTAVVIGPRDPELRQTHMLKIELEVIHDDDPEYLLDVAVAAAKAAIRARGRDRPGGCAIDLDNESWWVEDRPAWLTPDRLAGRRPWKPAARKAAALPSGSATETPGADRRYSELLQKLRAACDDWDDDGLIGELARLVEERISDAGYPTQGRQEE